MVDIKCPEGHECTSNCRRNGCPCDTDHAHIMFAARISHVGKNKQAQIYVPKNIDVLLVPGNMYKITLEEIEDQAVEDFKKREIDKGIAEALKKSQS